MISRIKTFLKDNNTPLGGEVIEELDILVLDPLRLTKTFISSFNLLFSKLRECPDSEAKSFIEKYKPITLTFLKFYHKLTANLELGKTNARMNLSTYISENYSDLLTFFYIFKELQNE